MSNQEKIYYCIIKKACEISSVFSYADILSCAKKCLQDTSPSGIEYATLKFLQKYCIILSGSSAEEFPRGDPRVFIARSDLKKKFKFKLNDYYEAKAASSFSHEKIENNQIKSSKPMNKNKTITQGLWTKEEYLSKEHVRGLIEFIITKNAECDLNHQYDVEYKAWRKHLIKNNDNPRVFIQSLNDAIDKYFWIAEETKVDNNEIEAGFEFNSRLFSYKDNTKILEKLSDQIKKSIHDRNEEQTFVNCIKILEWGQVFKGSAKWVIEAYEQGVLCRKISFATKILDGEDSSHLDWFLENEGRMDSGLTKIYSLASEKSIIYDDRVGAALGLLSRKYLETKTQENKVPIELNFMRGRPKERNPSQGKFKFNNREKKSSYRHAQSNLMANWLIGELVSRLGPKWDRRSLEAALFMIGYRVA